MRQTDVRKFFLHLTDAGKSPKTAENYAYRVSQFVEWCEQEDVRPTRASRAHVREYLHRERERLRGASVAVDLAALRAFFQWQVVAGRRRSDPTGGLAAGDRGSVPIEPFSVDDLNALLDATFTERDRALILLSISSGAKRSEIIDLKIEDIDWANGTVRLGSAGSARRVHVGRLTVKSVRDYIGARSEGWLWLAEHGGKLTEQGAYIQLQALARRAGVEPASWRRFRVTFAANQARSDDEAVHLQEVLGLTSVDLKSARRYARRFGGSGGLRDDVPPEADKLPPPY